MTEEQLIRKIGIILGKKEKEVIKTPYVTLMRELVETWERDMRELKWAYERNNL
jgi:hypothetical protein